MLIFTKEIKLRPLSLEDFFKDETTSLLLLRPPSATVNQAEEYQDIPDPDKS